MDWISVGCCVLSFVLYYNTLDAGFVYDDRRAILTNPDLMDTSPFRRLLENDFWGTPLTDGGSHGSYRPLCVLTYRLNYAVGGFQPRGYHLVNVLMHCLATALVVRVTRELLPARRSKVAAAVAGLTFASHPIHTEAVAGIVGRADLAACIFFLLSFLSYMAHSKYRDLPCCEYQINEATITESNNKYRISKTQRHVNGYLKSYDSEQKATYAELMRRSCIVCSSDQFTCRGVVVHIIYCMKRLLSSSDAGVNRRWPLKALRLLLFSEDMPAKLAKPDCRTYNAEDGNGFYFMKCCFWWDIKTFFYLLTTVVLAAAAMFSKETGLTALLGCAFYDIIRGVQEGSWNSKKRMQSLAFLGMSAGLLLSIRLHLTSTPPQFASADNPTARDSSITVRVLTFMYLPVFNFFLLFCPTTLSFDWSMDSIARIHSILDPRNVMTSIFYYLIWRTSWFGVQRIWKEKIVKDVADKNVPKYRIRTHKRKVRVLSDSVCEVPYKFEECRCSVCRQPLSDSHSATCRTSNNNNSVHHAGACCCSANIRLPKRTLHSSKVHRQSQERNILVALLMAVAFLTLSFLPATNLLFYVGFVVAERVLYLPSVGYCLLLGIGASRIGCGKGRCYAFLLVTLAFSARTIQRNADWKDEESLFRSAIKVNPPKAYGNLGSILSAQGRDSEAEAAFHKALSHRPNMADVHYNLGILQQRRKRYEEAIKSFESAIQIRPSLALAYVNLGASLLALGRCTEAASALSAGAKADGARARDRRVHDAARASALVQLGALHAQHGRLSAAITAYRQALVLVPPDYPAMKVYNLLGETYSRLSRWSDAEQAYMAAVEAAPTHVPAHLSFAKMIAKNDSRVVEAEQWFRRAMKLAPDDAGVHRYYGDFLASHHRFVEAADQFVIAANLVPTDLDMASAAATALREAGRRQEAESWYKKLAEMNPKDARSHTNLGAILHLNGKYDEAAVSYRRALKLQPNDMTTIANLRKLHAMRSKNVQ